MDDILDLLAIEGDRKINLDIEYKKFRQYADQVEAKYAEIRGEAGAPNIVAKVLPIIKKNWKQISILLGAVGIPIGIADVGAFAGVLKTVGGLWPF